MQFDFIPDSNVPLVADYSSIILAEPLDVSKFGLIYAGAQKNIGPAGLVVVIVREDLLGDVIKGTPTMLDYKIHADMRRCHAFYLRMVFVGLSLPMVKSTGRP